MKPLPPEEVDAAIEEARLATEPLPPAAEPQLPLAPPFPSTLIQCPSASSRNPQARAFAVHSPSQGTARYLEQPLLATPELLRRSHPARPEQLLRFAAPCAQEECIHFCGRCRLAEQVARHRPVVTAPPPCRIRADCRWFHQHGAPICLRCPQIVTAQPRPPLGTRLLDWLARLWRRLRA